MRGQAQTTLQLPEQQLSGSVARVKHLKPKRELGRGRQLTGEGVRVSGTLQASRLSHINPALFIL